MPYIEKRIKSGELLEIERYFVSSTGRKLQRCTNENETSPKQEDINNRNAQKRLIRLINTNFSGKNGDLFITLTYAEQVDEAKAKQEITNFVRRLKRFREKNGLEKIKYIVITEHQGKWHHHLIVNGIPNAVEEITRIWGQGRVHISKLDKTHNYEDLARYLIKNEKASKKEADIENTKEQRKKHMRRWNSSLNLKQPIIEIKEISKATLNTPPKPPKGYYMLSAWSMGCDIQGNLYMSYSCVRLEEQSTHKNKQSIRQRK